MANKKKIIQWLVTSLWICIGVGALVLLIAAMRKKDSKTCKGVSIVITGAEKTSFVDEKDILQIIESTCGGKAEGQKISRFRLRAIETDLEKDPWIRDVEIFFDDNEKLQVKVKEREPVARVFTTGGNTFYLDTAISRLPLSEKFSARLPVFTGFPSDVIVLSQADSNLLRDIVKISLAMEKDSFRMAAIDQVDITPQRHFEMIPKVGNSLLVFGDASDVDSKFDRLKLFYKNVLPKSGLNYYSRISFEFSNQVVAKRRGAEDIAADSIRALLMLQENAANAERMAGDSTRLFQQDNNSNTIDTSMIQQSIERSEADDNAAIDPKRMMQEQQTDPKPLEKPKPEEKPVANVVTVPAKPVTTKPVTTKPATVKPPATKTPTVKPVTAKPSPVKPVKKPGAQMPGRNDYK